MHRSDHAAGSSPVQPAPSASEIRAELDRILSSPHLQASQKRRAFLRFIVEETLAGRANRLKGHTIAVAVFGRDETFDSQTDPVVRLEARRLRRDLDCYYVDAGAHDAVRISVPKGSYVPRFEWHDAPPPEPVPEVPGPVAPDDDGTDGAGASPVASRWPNGRRNMAVVGLVAALIAIAAAASWFFPSTQRMLPSGSLATEPAVIVVPFRALSSREDSRYLADGISQELIANLMGFPGFRIYTLPSGFEQIASRTEPVRLGRDLGVTFVVNGAVNSNDEQIRVAVQMVDATTGKVLWSHTYHRPLTPQALMLVQRELAGEIAGALGQPYGTVASDLSLLADTPAVSSMQSYICVLRAFSYRRDFSKETFGPVYDCLEEAVRRDPDYSDAWAMLGWLHLDAGRFEFNGPENVQEEYRKAYQAASRAMSLEPNNTLALKAMSSIDHYLKRFEDSERLARQAVELNPYDPDTLAQLGWRLAVRGNFEEGIPILERAIERTVNPPGWYFYLIAVDHLMKGDYERMLEAAERSVGDSFPINQALIAIAAGELGQAETARTALEQMSTFAPLARDPIAHFRRHGATDAILDAVAQGLAKARAVAAQGE